VGSHAPALHTLPIAHANPHAPQLAKLAERSTHWPLQRAGVVPVTHPQVPARHCAPPGQTSPQIPQFCRSVARFTHAPLHAVMPGWHEVAHWLWLHTSPGAHANPHWPQSCGLDVRSTHWPKQNVGVPAVHVQVPEVHSVPTGQVLPQVPQLLASKFTFTQDPLQSLKPGGQVGAQVPDRQAPGGQASPHEPQLPALEARSTHWPLHSAGFWPIAH
jgi:hypothetical protein